MKQQILKKTMGGLLIAIQIMAPMKANAAPTAPPDYDTDRMERLHDNVLEYDELGDLIREYNPSVHSEITAAYDSSIQQMKDMEYSFKKNARTYDSWMKSYREEHGFSDSTVNNILNMSMDVARKKATEQELGAAFQEAGIDAETWAGYTNYMEVKETFQAIGNRYHDMVEDKETIKTTADMDSAIDQITAGAEQLMNQYNQLLSQKIVADKNKELQERLYQVKCTQLTIGMVTQNDVLASEKDMLTAEASAITIANGINNVRQTLCMMTGWAWDANPEIKGIPSLNLERIQEMNPEIDAVRAMNNNYTVRKTRHSKTKGDNGTRNNFLRTVDETEQKAAAKLKDLYSAVCEKKNAYESAVTAFEAAQLEFQKSELKHQTGALSDLQYLGTQVSYLQKKSAKDTAGMALFQAMEDYDWAMDGVASLN